MSALETLVGDTAVATQIATAISALDDVYDAKGAAAQALTDAKAYADGKDAAIAAAQSAADAAQDDVDALTTDVQANTSAIATLNGTGAGSVQKQVADAVAQIVADAPEAYDTLKEISDWISSHSGDASEMNSAIQQNTADIGELETAVAGKVDKVEGKQLSTNDYTTTEKNKLSGIEAGAQVNVIETVQVNGSPVSPSDKTVNISVPTGALASKSEVAESDLASALASKINAKADDSALAAIAGVLLCSAYPSLTPYTGSMPGIKAFVAAVFGGIGSIPGAFIGGILLGIIEILARAYISSQLSDAIVFSVLIIVLVVRPTGLMGKEIQEKV